MKKNIINTFRCDFEIGLKAIHFINLTEVRKKSINVKIKISILDLIS